MMQAWVDQEEYVDVVCIAQPPSLGNSRTVMAHRAVWRVVAEA
jgi:hypothetical protein